MANSSCCCGKGCEYNRNVMFVREDVFYFVVGTYCENWANHADLNPGTVSIEDPMTGERLWPEGTMQ